MTRQDFALGTIALLLILAVLWAVNAVANSVAPVHFDPSAAAVGTGKPTPPRSTPHVASRSRVTPAPTPTLAWTTSLDLPDVLLRIRRCESDNDYRAENPTSSASGAWQITRATWDRYRGYRTAGEAPASVQDAKALQLYRARGTQPWRASRRCWR